MEKTVPACMMLENVYSVPGILFLPCCFALQIYRNPVKIKKRIKKEEMDKGREVVEVVKGSHLE